MPASLIKMLALAALAFSATTSAAAIDLPARDLEKRTAWTSSSTCPSGNGDIYTGPAGNQFTVMCNRDSTSGNSLTSGSVSGTAAAGGTTALESCMQWCGRTSGCLRVTFTGNVQTSGNCWLKGGETPTIANSGVVVAQLPGAAA